MIIEVKDLSIAYGAKLAVQSVNMHVKQGEFVSIVGPNGCGKSTLLKAIARVVKPRSGQIQLWGKDTVKLHSKQIAKRIAVLPQIRQTPDDFSVESLINHGRYPHSGLMGRLNAKDRQIVTWAIKKTGLSHHRHKMINQLSGGERQRAWIAMALAQKTDVIILDEPTTFLDLAHQLDVLELLKKLNVEDNVTIVLVIHNLNQAIRYSDRCYVMKRGRIAAVGQPDSVIDTQLLHDIFYVDSDFYTDARNDKSFFTSYKLSNLDERFPHN